MPRLAVEWKASGHRARGFYHPDEERLVVCMDRPGTFAALVDAGDVSFDLDDEGGLLGLTVESQREDWEVTPDLMAPRIGIPATIRFVDSPQALARARLLTDPDHMMLCIRLADAHPVHVVEACEGLLLELGERSELLAVWIVEIQEDYGSRRERAWRTGGRVT